MAKFLTKINGKDFSHLIAIGKLDWAKNDVEHEKAGRDKTKGEMHRQIITKKRACSFTTVMASYEALHPLAVELDNKYVDLTILDLIEGEKTYRCYGTKISAACYGNLHGKAIYDKCQFELTEV